MIFPLTRLGEGEGGAIGPGWGWSLSGTPAQPNLASKGTLAVERRVLRPLPPTRVEVPAERPPYFSRSGHFPLGVPRRNLLARRHVPRLRPLAGAGVAGT